jgi:hypothetical protein
VGVHRWLVGKRRWTYENDGLLAAGIALEVMPLVMPVSYLGSGWIVIVLSSAWVEETRGQFKIWDEKPAMTFFVPGICAWPLGSRMPRAMMNPWCWSSTNAG